MSVIIQKLKFAGSKGEAEYDTLFDSGASYSFIKGIHAMKLGMVDNLPEPMKFETAKENNDIIIVSAVRLSFIINGVKLSDEFLVSDEMSEDVIIGAKTLQAWRIKLDFEHDTVIVDEKAARLMLK